MMSEFLLDGGTTAAIIIMLLDLRARVKRLEAAWWTLARGSQ